MLWVGQEDAQPREPVDFQLERAASRPIAEPKVRATSPGAPEILS